MKYLDKIINWYFNKRALPFWGILLIDNVIVFCSFIGLFLYFNQDPRTFESLLQVTINILYLLIFFNISFRVFHTYSGILRYSSFVDLVKVGNAMVCSGLMCYTAYRVAKYAGIETLTRLVSFHIIGTMLISMLFMWILRICVKTFYDITSSSAQCKRTYIFGIKDDGIAIAKHIRSERPLRYSLQGFATVQPEMDGHVLMGKRIHLADDRLVKQMTHEKVNTIIVSPQRLEAFRQQQELQVELMKAGIQIYITQGAKRLDEDFSTQQLKEVNIEDLLPRDEIQMDMISVGKQLTGKCIMITGSAGSIGSEMVRQIAIYKPSVMVLIDQAETPQHDIRLMMKNDWPDIQAHTIVASITEWDHMESVFKKYKPQYVFHAAAYKHVPMMEDNPSESVKNNIIGTRNIADLSVKYGVKKFVMISTDKAVNPTNVMGCSKRICEIYVQSLDKAIKDGKMEGQTQFVTTRFGNVLGSNGSVIPLFKEQIKHGGPLTVTDPNIIRFFMLIPEACKLVLEAGTKGNGGEIFVFDMGQPVKIADLAKRMILLSGAQNVEIKYTGLRPGEKLYEEVLNEKETTKPSFHEKIRIATVREYDYQDVCKDIDQLADISIHFDDMKTVAKMKAIVPEFRSNNSVYSILDASEPSPVS